MRYCHKLERTPGTDLAAAKALDPEHIQELAKRPLAELEGAGGGGVSARGYTLLHELLSILIDQVTDLRQVTEAYVRTQVTFGGQVGGKQHVARPDSPIALAKKIKIDQERDHLDDWYENTMKGVATDG